MPLHLPDSPICQTTKTAGNRFQNPLQLTLHEKGACRESIGQPPLHPLRGRFFFFCSGGSAGVNLFLPAHVRLDERQQYSTENQSDTIVANLALTTGVDIVSRHMPTTAGAP